MRFTAIDTILNRFEMVIPDLIEDKPISEFFGCNTFTSEKMAHYLDQNTFKQVTQVIQSGEKLSRSLADVIAEAMKKWAMDMGATHYAHWFQPLTGRTAEKHDSFFTIDLDTGSAIEDFGGNELAQQEPDGSSFPGGGLRTTFEARGYTAWDPSSPAFILDEEAGKTLCIPTIFVTYSGESLDYKLPLLKSQHYIGEAATKVCKLFNDDVNKVEVTLGWEQEYFLVDEALFLARPDLVMCGRTLLGKHSPKGQQLDDHYFGSIPARIYAFMRDLETECHKLGIPVRTRHNEVGPGQYELAPMFEEVNVAVDHNQLLMDLMDRVAYRHKLRVLLHEKPFAGVNGSGKHNNWSLATNTGKNLLSPGKDPGSNLQFLTFFVNTIRAVYEHADLLRASIASVSNDHRLGANEAPPAIVSVFIGDQLNGLLDQIEIGENKEGGVEATLDLVKKIPELKKDNTDRNRTSPFAFTGNKFEIRMVGSTMNCSSPMTIMNTIVGEQLNKFYGEVSALIESGTSKEKAILDILRRYIEESKAIRFEGDGYSDEWKEEAAKRGLSNFTNTPDALKAYISEASKALFSNTKILSEHELEAHYEVKVEHYILMLQIESRTMGEMLINHILPASIGYQTVITENIKNLKALDLDESLYGGQLEIVRDISVLINALKKDVNLMTEKRQLANSYDDASKTAQDYCYEIKPIMERLRENADRLEYLVDDRVWPLVKYRELMFMK